MDSFHRALLRQKVGLNSTFCRANRSGSLRGGSVAFKTSQQSSEWIYLYRATDNYGKTLDFMLSKRQP